ncbi:hypothetical protein H4219_003128 [Mycoemilia scoparia]|uniref:Uncharacterized protein n=1 Tax=Mycoemilia scoparia TaxID=417184 RepID=A0A9W8DTF2_9FUNG|nr:hypothetical protein H4219_003128 [Mycoemilia scoparia]
MRAKYQRLIQETTDAEREEFLLDMFDKSTSFLIGTKTKLGIRINGYQQTRLRHLGVHAFDRNMPCKLETTQQKFINLVEEIHLKARKFTDGSDVINDVEASSSTGRQEMSEEVGVDSFERMVEELLDKNLKSVSRVSETTRSYGAEGFDGDYLLQVCSCKELLPLSISIGNQYYERLFCQPGKDNDNSHIAPLPLESILQKAQAHLERKAMYDDLVPFRPHVILDKFVKYLDELVQDIADFKIRAQSPLPSSSDVDYGNKNKLDFFVVINGVVFHSSMAAAMVSICDFVLEMFKVGELQVCQEFMKRVISEPTLNIQMQSQPI